MAAASYTTPVGDYDTQLGDYFALLKQRGMSLVVFTALVGLLAAPVSVHPVIAFSSILFVAIGAGASGALNMWWDADIDAVMRRTAKRPIPSGRVPAGEAMSLGLALSGLSVMMLGLSANLLAAGLLAFTIFFYAVIYSMWLKRLTPQNIVIGGAAGAFPPVIGWVIATGSMSVEPWLMFALIFMWTPPHFWALALFMKSDYDDAGVPMLTPSEVLDEFDPQGSVQSKSVVSWADTERDASAWLGNAMQTNAAGELYKLESPIKQAVAQASGGQRDAAQALLQDWRKLTTSDHFYYMCTKFYADGEVHKYFSPYASPYDAYINFMNVLDHLRMRTEAISAA